ncbi:S8 family serine peptidase [Pseudoalteromonas fenneropenaei]|uniref:S8 family serine peptidase n=1 Tax=Pseudoalteromonas fenneropenaei TaxID=1737459 RepID=A0ABV7CJF8_9GAMM
MQKLTLCTLALASACYTPSLLANSPVSEPTLAPLHLALVPAQAIAEQYIVVFKRPLILAEQSAETVAQYARLQAKELSLQYGVAITRHFYGTLNGVVVRANKTQLAQLRRAVNIAYIEQDQLLSVAPLSMHNNAMPEWGLDRIDQRNLPLNSQYHHDYDGRGVTAYVIDTGINIAHQDFAGRAQHGFDFIDNDPDSSDCNGHGTHVAGTIGASQYGVAKQANLVGVRVLGCNGSGSTSGVIAGVDWVRANASGPSVANLSLGGSASQALDDAVNAAVAAGISMVVAAGNDNSNACYSSPARAADAITVGATASNDSRSGFSNYGSCLDIYAPGTDITSTWYSSNTAIRTISGTSMAAPHVAGALALYLQQDPSLTPAQLTQELITRASQGKVRDAGSGSPNLLLFTLGADVVDPGVPVTALAAGVPLPVAGSTGSQQLYSITVPAGAPSLNIVLAGGNGDADMYVQHGSLASFEQFVCRPYKSGNNESCAFTTPATGEWYVMLHGYQQFSGATLTASLADVPTACDGLCLHNDVPVTSLAGGLNSELLYQFVVPANVEVTISTQGGAGDVDLYVRKDARPTTLKYDCRPFATGNNETCRLNSGTGGTYQILLRGTERYSGVTLYGRY